MPKKYISCLLLFIGYSVFAQNHEHGFCCNQYRDVVKRLLDEKKFEEAKKVASEMCLSSNCPDLKNYGRIAQDSIKKESEVPPIPPDPKKYKEIKDQELWDNVKNSLDPDDIQKKYLDECARLNLPCKYKEEAEYLRRAIITDSYLWIKAESAPNDTIFFLVYLEKCQSEGLKCIYADKAKNILTTLRRKSEEEMWAGVKNSDDPFTIRDNYLKKSSLMLHKREAEKLIEAIIKSRLPKMLLITGGTFEIGDVLKDNPKIETEKPYKGVQIRDFYLAATEVTFAEYDAFCFATQRTRLDDKTWGRGRHPAIHVEWYDAVEYCNWRSKIDGLDTVYAINKETVPSIGDSDQKKWEVTANWSANGYRLPREVEWEYAAREGGKKVRFGNGKSIANTDQLNFNGMVKFVTNYSVRGDYRRKTVEVGSLNSPNALGLHDMTGNVFEWCWESYTELYKDFFTANSMQYPTTPGRGRTRVARGGAWSSEPDMCRNAYRHYWQPAAKLPDVGFRLARSSK